MNILHPKELPLPLKHLDTAADLLHRHNFKMIEKEHNMETETLKLDNIGRFLLLFEILFYFIYLTDKYCCISTFKESQRSKFFLWHNICTSYAREWFVDLISDIKLLRAYFVTSQKFQNLFWNALLINLMSHLYSKLNPHFSYTKAVTLKRIGNPVFNDLLHLFLIFSRFRPIDKWLTHTHTHTHTKELIRNDAQNAVLSW